MAKPLRVHSPSLFHRNGFVRGVFPTYVYASHKAAVAVMSDGLDPFVPASYQSKTPTAVRSSPSPPDILAKSRSADLTNVPLSTYGSIFGPAVDPCPGGAVVLDLPSIVRRWIHASRDRMASDPIAAQWALVRRMMRLLFTLIITCGRHWNFQHVWCVAGSRDAKQSPNGDMVLHGMYHDVLHILTRFFDALGEKCVHLEWCSGAATKYDLLYTIQHVLTHRYRANVLFVSTSQKILPWLRPSTGPLTSGGAVCLFDELHQVYVSPGDIAGRYGVQGDVAIRNLGMLKANPSFTESRARTMLASGAEITEAVVGSAVYRAFNPTLLKDWTADVWERDGDKSLVSRINSSPNFVHELRCASEGHIDMGGKSTWCIKRRACYNAAFIPKLNNHNNK